MPSLQAPVWLHWALGQCHDNQAAPDTAEVQSFNHQYNHPLGSVMFRVYLFVAGCGWRVGGGKPHSNVATLCHGAALGSSHPHCFASDNYQLILESRDQEWSETAAPPPRHHVFARAAGPGRGRLLAAALSNTQPAAPTPTAAGIFSRDQIGRAHV